MSLSGEQHQEMARSIRLSEFAMRASIVIAFIDHAQIFKRYSVESFVGAGSGGVALAVRANSTLFVAKVMFDNGNFSACADSKLLTSLQEKGVLYINQLVESSQDSAIMDGRKFHFCTLILEKGSADLSERPVFLSQGPEKWPKLLLFFGKLIVGFAELNFKGGVLHGDIKPGNILLKEGDGEVDPIIIDFNIMRVQNAARPLNDCQLRYAMKFRPPELLDVSTSGGEEAPSLWRSHCRSFYYSDSFLEDVYALGRTFFKLLRTNQRSRNRRDPTHALFLALVHKMTLPKDQRPTILDVCEDFLRITQHYGPEYPTFQFLVTRAAQLKRKPLNLLK